MENWKSTESPYDSGRGGIAEWQDNENAVSRARRTLGSGIDCAHRRRHNLHFGPVFVLSLPLSSRFHRFHNLLVFQMQSASHVYLILSKERQYRRPNSVHPYVVTCQSSHAARIDSSSVPLIRGSHSHFIVRLTTRLHPEPFRASTKVMARLGDHLRSSMQRV